jgi:hypothetical protein
MIAAGRADLDAVALGRLEAVVTFLEALPAARLAGFVACGAGRCFDLTGFAVLVRVAFCARALPAGERLVAGFNRVVLAFEADLTDRRADDREDSFFTLLATGVLMGNLPRC